MPAMIIVRPEAVGDIDRVREINERAFEGGPEAELVDALRDNCTDFLSLVAADDGRVVGHILFTPVKVEGAAGSATGMGLAPMAVLPDRQRSGIGSVLVRRGLELLQADGCPFVIVLGHPEYYPRFGFDRASRLGLRSQWDGIPDDAFMVTVFDPYVLPEGGGVASYRDEFDAAVTD